MAQAFSLFVQKYDRRLTLESKPPVVHDWRAHLDYVDQSEFRRQKPSRTQIFWASIGDRQRRSSQGRSDGEANKEDGKLPLDLVPSSAYPREVADISQRNG